MPFLRRSVNLDLPAARPQPPGAHDDRARANRNTLCFTIRESCCGFLPSSIRDEDFLVTRNLHDERPRIGSFECSDEMSEEVAREFVELEALVFVRTVAEDRVSTVIVKSIEYEAFCNRVVLRPLFFGLSTDVGHADIVETDRDPVVEKFSEGVADVQRTHGSPPRLERTAQGSFLAMSSPSSVLYCVTSRSR